MKKIVPISLIIAVMVWLIPAVSSAAVAWNPTLYGAWGTEASTLIEQDFRIRSYDGYYEDQSKSAWSYAWPNSINIMAMASAAKLNSNMYVSRLNNSITSNDNRWTFVNSKWGYDAVANPSITNRFYDDNAWLGWAIADAYSVDGVAAHLQRAKDAYTFTLSGEDTVQGGGIYWKETQYTGDPTPMKAISATAGAALTAAKLYSITNTASYHTDADRLLTWIWNTLRDTSTNLICNSIDINGVKDCSKFAYNQGVPMDAYTLLYAKTGTASYLTNAQTLSTAAESYYVDAATGKIKDGSYFAFTLVEGWLDLFNATGNSHYRDLVINALQYVHDNRDSNGRYPERWDAATPGSPLTTYKLLFTAPAARAYWRMAAIGASTLPVQSFITSANITSTASSSYTGLSPANTFNGSGLTGYLHDNDSSAATMWHTLAGGQGNTNPNPGSVAGAAWIKYMFNTSYSLGRMWIWNHNQLGLTTRGLRSVTVQYTTNGTSWTTLGTYNFGEAAGAAAYPHNVEVDFGGISATGVILTANSTNGNWGDTGPYYGLSEVKFGINTAAAGNIAPTATVTASSQYSTAYAKTMAVDGIIGLQGLGEWASLGELNPWIQLTWGASKAITKVVLFDRMNMLDSSNGGTLSFSDGSSIPVTDIANDGTPKVVTFATKNITWVKFQVSGGTGSNVGLSEMQVF